MDDDTPSTVPEKNRALEIVKEVIALWTWRFRPMDEVLTVAENTYRTQGLGEPTETELKDLVQQANANKAELRKHLREKGLAKDLEEDAKAAETPAQPAKKPFRTVFDFDEV